MKYAFLLFGAVFGFLMSRAGATTYDFYARLFLLGPPVESSTVGTISWHPQLLLVIAVGVAVSIPLYRLLQWRKAKAVFTGKTLDYTHKPWRKSLIVGSLLMGVGWGLAGTCPGTSLIMVGEGKMPALITIGGILIGTWIFGAQQSRTVDQS